MDLSNILTAGFTVSETIEFFVRIVAACLCGAIIGLERSKRFKEAGVRTHLIVCCASALFMILSKYGFSDVPVEQLGIRGADSSRIASQVVSGISFLCAGVIIKDGGNIRGLTTAAVLWMTAAIGMAFGAGLYIIGIFVTIATMGFQSFFHRVTFGNDSMVSNAITLTAHNDFSLDSTIGEMVRSIGGVFESSTVHHTQQTTIYRFVLRTKTPIPPSYWSDFIKRHPDVISLEYNILP